MASLCYLPYHLLPPIARAPRSLPSRRLLCLLSRRRSFVRGGSVVARLGPSGFSDFEVAEEWARELLSRAEGFVYTTADAAVNSYPDASATAGTAAAASEVTKQRDWLSGITDYMEFVLKVLKDGLSALHVPYSYGFAIILLTILVKVATFPLTKKQVESALAMKSLQPQVKEIQERYAGDQERIQLETARLYKLAGVNPLAGCLPTLATIPVWIGLYRALSNVANEGLLTEGFFWIPSLAGPTTIASRQSGSGTSWLFPFISNDANQTSSQAVTKLLPLMIGYFALSVPSGLSLYWFTNNVLSTAQQIWLQKFGGARNPVKEFSDKMSRELQQNTQKHDNEVGSKKLNNLDDKSSFVGLPPGDSLTSKNDVKSSSTGILPGERFKQIKEQEARRKREKEEARRRSEEAVKPHQTNTKESNLDALHKQEPQGDHVQKHLSSTENGLACDSNALVDEQSTSNDLKEG